MDQTSNSKKTRWRGSRSYNITVNIILVLLAILSYILFSILFLSPQSYHISSFIYVEKGRLPPASAVTLINTLLGATTSAIVGRCIEQSLWLKLTRRAPGKALTVKESRRLAAWGSSSKARITYCFNGASLLLKLGGPFMIGMAIVSTVLTFGISSAQISTVSTEFVQNQTGIWAGWLDAANDDYNGGNFQDVPGVVAALASLNNLTAPASPVCLDSGCYATAASVSIHASCAWPEKQYPRSYTCLTLRPTRSSWIRSAVRQIHRSAPSSTARFPRTRMPISPRGRRQAAFLNASLEISPLFLESL